MPEIQTTLPFENRRLRAIGHDLLPAPFSQTFGAATNPPEAGGNSFGRNIELSGERARQADPMTLFDTGRDAPTPPITEDAFSDRYGSLGLQWRDGMTEGEAQILGLRKRDAIRRADIFRRGPTSAIITGSLVGMLLDPLEIGLAFLPIVGPVKFAAWTARFGTLGARVARGAVEGTAGAALVEPLVFSAMSQEQADYTSIDSLLNVALGGVFGGGLHVGAGLIGDALAKVSARSREVALRTAVGQLADGRRIDVEPVLRADIAEQATVVPPAPRDIPGVPQQQYRFDSPEHFRASRQAARDLLEGGGLHDLVERVTSPPRQPRVQTLTQFIVDEGGLLDQGGELRNLGINARSRPGFVTKKGAKIDEMGLRAFEAGLFSELGDRPTVRRFLEAIEGDFKGFEPRVRDEDAAELQAFRAERDDVEDLEQAFVEAGVQDVRAVPVAEIREQLRQVAELPDDFVTADPVVSRAIDDSLAAGEGELDLNGATVELDDLLAELDEMRASGALDEADMREIESADELLREAEDVGAGYRAAAVCLSRVA